MRLLAILGLWLAWAAAWAVPVWQVETAGGKTYFLTYPQAGDQSSPPASFVGTLQNVDRIVVLLNTPLKPGEVPMSLSKGAPLSPEMSHKLEQVVEKRNPSKTAIRLIRGVTAANPVAGWVLVATMGGGNQSALMDWITHADKPVDALKIPRLQRLLAADREVQLLWLSAVLDEDLNKTQRFQAWVKQDADKAADWLASTYGDKMKPVVGLFAKEREEIVRYLKSLPPGRYLIVLEGVDFIGPDSVPNRLAGSQ